MLEKKKKVDSQCFYLSLIFNAKNQVIKDIDRHVWCVPSCLRRWMPQSTFLVKTWYIQIHSLFKYDVHCLFKLTLKKNSTFID